MHERKRAKDDKITYHEDGKALTGWELSEPLREGCRGHVAHLPWDHVPALAQHGRDGLVHPKQAGGLWRQAAPSVGGGRLGQDTPIGTGILHFNVGHPIFYCSASWLITMSLIQRVKAEASLLAAPDPQAWKLTE